MKTNTKSTRGPRVRALRASILTAIAAVLCAFPFNTRADTLWDTNLFGPPIFNISHAVSDCYQQQQSGDVFTLATSATVEHVNWWGFYWGGLGVGAPPYPDYFTIQIYPITAGIPATIAAFSYVVGDAPRVDTGVSGYAELYAYSADIPSTSLGAGSYLLSIVNNTFDASDPGATPGGLWWWNNANNITDGLSWIRSVPHPFAVTPPPAAGDAWDQNLNGGAGQSGPLAFNITGAFVPEPTSAALLLGGGALLALRRRRA